MILRVMIGLGVILMLTGFGAAGWQYWQGAREPVQPDVLASSQDKTPWLSDRSGGVVPVDDAEAYLRQDRYAPSRLATVIVTAPLAALLVEGETLPDAAYLEVMADIRAPKLAEGLCPALVRAGAAACTLKAARVVPGSVDLVQGAARFRIELAYREAAVDPAFVSSHVLDTKPVAVDLDPVPDAGDALAAMVNAARATCPEAEAMTCRILRLTLNWAPGSPVRGKAGIAWLASLPDGVLLAPPLVDAAAPSGG